MTYKSFNCVLRDPNCSAWNFDINKYKSIRLLFERYSPNQTHKLEKSLDFKGFRYAVMRLVEGFDEDAQLYIDITFGNPNANGLKCVIVINYDEDEPEAVIEAEELFFELKLLGEIQSYGE